MSEYKRLTTRREDGKAIYACSLRWESEDEQAILDRLANLEDKIESGKWAELPCKVGDIIFCCKYDPVIGNWIIEREVVAEFNVFFYANLIVQRQGFMTEEQAETRLKELKGEK